MLHVETATARVARQAKEAAATAARMQKESDEHGTPHKVLSAVGEEAGDGSGVTTATGGAPLSPQEGDGTQESWSRSQKRGSALSPMGNNMQGPLPGKPEKVHSIMDPFSDL